MKRDIKKRTKKFAIDCWKVCDELPNRGGFNAYINQLIRCSSSVGANYRAAQRAKSTTDFIYKLKIVEEEADESMYFLELLMEISTTNFHNELKRLYQEANELLAIIVASIKTARKNQ